jgi:hypothetical protein
VLFHLNFEQRQLVRKKNSHRPKIKMVSQYNEFVREYAKKCRKQGKKFELADAAKAWRGIKGGDWRSFLGLKRKSPVFYTSAEASREMNDRAAKTYAQQGHAVHAQLAARNTADDRFGALRRQQASQMTYPFYDANTKTTYHRPGGSIVI